MGFLCWMAYNSEGLNSLGCRLALCFLVPEYHRRAPCNSPRIVLGEGSHEGLYEQAHRPCTAFHRCLCLARELKGVSTHKLINLVRACHLAQGMHVISITDFAVIKHLNEISFRLLHDW